NIYDSHAPLLPARFAVRRPNVIIIFFESLSSRLTSVYNQELIDVTPNLQSFVDESGSTVFKQFYNASSPTATGLFSLLCSSLPAFGNNEIGSFNKFAGHRALCLPAVLKKSGGYETTVYMMGQEKKFASMQRMMENMGIDRVFSKEDLDGEIDGKAIYWGYEDHQLFPAALQRAKQLSATSPFFLAVSTINTHPPFFDASGKKISFGDGSNELLESLRSSDDAFGQFWQEFKNSELYNDTILIVVADHSMFPGRQLNELIPSQSYFDENFFVTRIPDSVLPREVNVLSSAIDFTPTLLHILGINVKNSFEGHSIFDDRTAFPSIMGMANDGFYVNEKLKDSAPVVAYSLTSELDCPLLKNEDIDLEAPLTLCETRHFYLWKKQMFEDGRLWGDIVK
ncbi:MAG: LTA synthase family protein, partial [Candidatus Magasanikbacteria bacterium]|nr:LTA synthase family protein [Candidatus Magasanikbacteria bacterium]